MTYIIKALDHYGRGISKTDDKIIFIENALPDEEVEIEVIKEKKNIIEGNVTNYLKKSSKRIEPNCPYFNECGGCQIMMLAYDDQLSYKENKVKEVLKKFGNIPDTLIKPIISSNQFYYRNKTTLQVNKKIGFYKKNSYDLVTIDYCPISNRDINKIIDILKQSNLEGVKQIVIRSSGLTKDIMVIFYLDNTIDINLIIAKLKSSCTSIIINLNNKYEIIYGNDYIYEYLNNYKYKISPDSFFQVNTKQSIKMYDKVKEYCHLTGKEKILDLYCGTGTIGIYVSDKAASVEGIEINKYAINDAIENAKINNINNINFKCGDVKDLIKNINNIDIVIVDPPRSGLDSNALNSILKIKPKTIVYVSCDPVTLARDLKLLSNNYEVIEVTPVDMFPNTYHVENVVLLRYNNETYF